MGSKGNWIGKEEYKGMYTHCSFRRTQCLSWHASSHQNYNAINQVLLKEKDHTDRVWDSIAMKATEISCVSIDEIQKLLILTTLTEMLKVIK